MITLLQQGQYMVFALLLITIIISLSVHEYAHAASAKHFGDNTAELQGRLTLSPLAHMDPMGLLMVVLVGFGWAKPVPTDPRNFNSKYATPLIAAAGPFANLVLAFLAINLHAIMMHLGVGFAMGPVAVTFVSLFLLINMALMLFNLIPLGPLDGHYILPFFLSRRYAEIYVNLNARYGTLVILALVVLSIAGFSVFGPVLDAARWIVPYLRIV